MVNTRTGRTRRTAAPLSADFVVGTTPNCKVADAQASGDPSGQIAVEHDSPSETRGPSQHSSVLTDNFTDDYDDAQSISFEGSSPGLDMETSPTPRCGWSAYLAGW